MLNTRASKRHTSLQKGWKSNMWLYARATYYQINERQTETLKHADVVSLYRQILIHII